MAGVYFNFNKNVFDTYRCVDRRQVVVDFTNKWQVTRSSPVNDIHTLFLVFSFARNYRDIFQDERPDPVVTSLTKSKEDTDTTDWFEDEI